jgi:hypothetical protein
MRHASMRVFACALLAMVCGLESTRAHAAGTVTVAIPAQPLSAALSEFARQTGLQLLYVTQIAKAQTSKGARAGLPAADTLTELLQGTGLNFEFLNDRTVRIFAPPTTEPTARSPAAAAAPQARVQRRASAPLTDMDNVEITARRSEAELADYVQSVPLSVSMVTADRLAEQHLERVIDYGFSVPGVYTQAAGGPGQESLIVRGVLNGVSFYIDDIAMDTTGLFSGNAGSYALDLMPYDLERFEVWRGPQGTVSGADSQIGLIRYAFKRADVSSFRRTSARTSSPSTVPIGPAKPSTPQSTSRSLTVSSRCAGVSRPATRRATSTTSTPESRASTRYESVVGDLPRCGSRPTRSR